MRTTPLRRPRGRIVATSMNYQAQTMVPMLLELKCACVCEENGQAEKVRRVRHKNSNGQETDLRYSVLLSHQKIDDDYELSKCERNGNQLIPITNSSKVDRTPNTNDMGNVVWWNKIEKPWGKEKTKGLTAR